MNGIKVVTKRMMVYVPQVVVNRHQEVPILIPSLFGVTSRLTALIANDLSARLWQALTRTKHD
jgi:hypothetical protein